MLQQNVINLQLLALLNNLKDCVSRQDPEICDYLKRIREKPGRGKGWTLCLINHLIITLGITSGAFSSLTAAVYVKGPSALS